MKKTGSKIIQEVIKRVTTAVTNSGFAKFKLAQELYWARNVITWSLTDYGSWTAFCEQHVLMGNSTIYRYILTAEKVSIYGYTQNDIKRMISECGWANFSLGIVDMNRKLSVNGFIDKYRNFQVEEREKKQKPNSRAYMFRLPVRQANKLDAYLMAYGMTEGPNGQRCGVQKAMQTLVNRKL